MAPTLTSNSFLLSTTPHSKLTLKLPRLPVYANNQRNNGPFPPFRLGKSSGDSNSEQGGQTDERPANSNPFRFSFGGKVPDMTSLIPVMSYPSSGLSFGNPRRKDPASVFVAGATGQVGVRVSQTLLREGFTVRAGIPDLGAAQELARLAANYKIISKEESKRLNAVESAFEDAESIAKAIGNASKVVITIGPGENGPSAEVSTSDALRVVEGAELAGVGHVVVIYDGNSATSSTYNLLDGISTFFNNLNNLFSGSQPLTVMELLQKVIETDVSYTFIKTSLTEDYSPESSYNVVISGEESAGANPYKVARSQIASLVADVFSNTEVAENKVVEVYTDPEAPLRRVNELFSAIPEDGRRKAYAEVLQKAKAEEEARLAVAKADEAAKAAKKLEEEVKKLSEQEAKAASLAEEAQKMAEAAGTSTESLLTKAKDTTSGISWQKFSSQIASTVQKTSEKPKVQIATVRGQAKARSLQPQKAVVKQSTPKPPVVKPKEDKPKEVRKVFGGLFTQETMYVDDD